MSKKPWLNVAVVLYCTGTLPLTLGGFASAAVLTVNFDGADFLVGDGIS